MFGITEASDASVNYSWTEHIDNVEGAVIITKAITEDFIETVMDYKDKVIIHVTCTGYGGSKLEPNVPTYKKQLQMVRKLLAAGFPERQLVLRIDPLFPTEKGLATAEKVIAEGSPLIHRIRVSVVDLYPHVRERMKRAGCPLLYGENGFQASKEQMRLVDDWLQEMTEKYNLPAIESCGEKALENVMRVGCVSDIDKIILGLPQIGEEPIEGKRAGCLCSHDKTELIRGEGARQPCKHGCLYCYWKYPHEKD